MLPVMLDSFGAMISRTLKKVTTATAFVALAGSVLGAGTAGAQEMSSVDSVKTSQIQELSSRLFGDSFSSSEDSEAPEGSGLIEKYEDVDGLQDKLPADEAQKVLNGTFTAKKNPEISVTFNEDGTLNFNDGCNSGGGSYKLDQTDAIVVENLNSTMRVCAPDEMADADALNAILSAKPVVFPVEGNTFALGSQGQVIQFEKAEN
ncbi:putative secreted protein [Corynebacterium aurimucosum ATCC 700975]|uniref:Putative secreted protein n=2 Tax=Corynebacterium aurimucosum TaxID=169292 RepID=C3PHL7_CORA7|nr:putative secreted protein [Corynebacterium aurimucosum ATCC 700975]QQU92567.1 META domain-containing protein [Corynebacterium aurimucosum]